MCGITGFIDPDGRVARSEKVLRRMMRALIHRGPDDEGTYCHEGAYLGHRRLSIIDLEGGHQPIANEDGTVLVVCNGEIYNFQSLREGLEERGHVFKTRSDSEVLVHLYEERGRDMLDDLVGMFALAVWDARRRTLLLARDRMGQKPLYYYVGRGGIVFGSELRAVMFHPHTPRDVNPWALRKYLLHDSVPAPDTILDGVRKLEPGEWLTFQDGRVSQGYYWDLSFSNERVPTLPDDEDALADMLWERLLESTRLRLISDVPLGVFLSGGIDSTTVVALMSELMPADQIKTFSIGFENPSFDESSYAREVADFFGTDHRERLLGPDTMLELLPGILGSMSEPLADASIIPTYLLSAFTRRHVTVALGGDGGDELMLGYPTFQAHRLSRLYGLVPQAVHEHLIRPMIHNLPVSTDNISLDFKLKRFLDGMSYPPVERHFVWVGTFDPRAQTSILSSEVLETTRDWGGFDDVWRYERRARPRDTYDLLSYLYAKLYLQDDILVKVDRASMAHALEARAPFLDHNVVDLLTALPTKMKMRGLTMKYLLKKMLKGRVPETVLKRPKKGFGIPVAEWLKGPLRPFAEDLLRPSRLERAGLFDAEGVRTLFDEHLLGRRDNRKQLWNLLTFQLWMRYYGPDARLPI